MKLELVFVNNESPCCVFPSERMKKEVDALLPPRLSVNLISIPEGKRKHSAWVGGSLVAYDYTSNRRSRISREEHEESGPSIINRKCPNT